MIGAFIKEFFAESSSLRQLIGMNPMRIHETAGPKGENRPRIVWHLISSPPARDQGSRANQRRTLIQLDCYGGTPSDANRLADAVESLFDPPDQTATYWPQVYAGIRVTGAFIEDRRGAYDVDAGVPTPAACQQVDVVLWHSWPAS